MAIIFYFHGVEGNSTGKQLRKYTGHNAVDRETSLLKYFRRCVGVTKIKCVKIKYTYTRYIAELASDKIFLT